MKKIETSLTFRDDREKFEFFVLAALYGIVFFNFLVWANLSGDISPKPDFHLFILSWSTCPAFGLISAIFLRRFREKNFRDDRLFYARMICVNSIGVLLLLQPMINWHPILGNGWILLLSFAGLQGLGFWAAKLLQGGSKTFEIESDPQYLFRIIISFVVVWLLTLHSLTRIIRVWTILNYVYFVVAGLILYRIIPKTEKSLESNGSFWTFGKFRVTKSFVLYPAVFLFLAYLLIDPNFRYQRYHGSYYLGPLSDLMAGKSLLVNINAQYGVLVFYFLKLFFNFLPVGFTSLSLVVTFLILAQYFLFYFIVRQLFRSEIYSFLVLLALILTNHFASVGWATIVPSVGPLRFGFAYSLMALVILRNQYPAKRNLILSLESLVIALAFFWSFEVCLYTVPAYLGFLFYESSEFGNIVSVDFKRASERIGMLAGFVFLIGGFLCLDIFFKSGQLPHPSYYLDYIFLYKGGFGMMGRPGIDYWCLIIGILYFSLFTLLAMSVGRKITNQTRNHFNAVVFLTFYGIFQFMYFIYRTSPNNLFHISMPGILLFAYWLYHFRSKDPSFLPGVLKKFVFGLAVFFVGVYSQTLIPTAVVKIKEQAMPLSRVWDRIQLASKDLPRDDDFAKRADALMRKYSDDKKVLPYFFSSNGDIGYEYRDYGLEVALYAGRVKNFPYNDVSQACICPKVIQRIFSYKPDLKPGDYLYTRPAVKTQIWKPYTDNVSFEERLVKNLFARYNLKLVEEAGGIAVYRVESIR